MMYDGYMYDRLWWYNISQYPRAVVGAAVPMLYTLHRWLCPRCQHSYQYSSIVIEDYSVIDHVHSYAHTVMNAGAMERAMSTNAAQRVLAVHITYLVGYVNSLLMAKVATLLSRHEGRVQCIIARIINTARQVCQYISDRAQCIAGCPRACMIDTVHSKAIARR